MRGFVMNITKSVRISLLLPLVGFMAACAGDGIRDPTAPAPMCADVAPFRPALSCIQQLVFTPSCAISGCHLNPGAQQGMDLSEGMAWTSIVGVVSSEDPNRDRVDPGNPDASYLILKLEGSPLIVGERMPLGGPYLSQAEIDVLRQWILDGAQDD